jgi:maltose/moltooligosaccharide transporter
LAIFNLVALLLTIPLSLLTKKWGKKRVFTLALTCMAISFGVAPWVHTPEGVFSMMAGAGIAWAAILSLPLALLKKHVLNENDLAVSGLLNRFMGIPQLVAALTVGYWVEQSPLSTAFGMSHNWSLAFIVASAMVILGIVVLQTVQENKA